MEPTALWLLLRAFEETTANAVLVNFDTHILRLSFRITFGSVTVALAFVACKMQSERQSR